MRTVTARTIAGTVSFNGTILVGSGFSVTKAATGVYAVYFPPGFRHIGTTATAYSTGSDSRAVVDPVSTPNAVTVRTFSVSALNTLADSGFSFTATGAGV